MSNINRRQFINRSLTGIAALGAGMSNMSFGSSVPSAIGTVKFGGTGLNVPILAFGTGSHGVNRGSNQTKLGMKSFVALARTAFERGVSFYDMADAYGSHTFVREFIKEIPREKATLLSKIWTTDNSWNKIGPVDNILDRFRVETGSDYIDIVLLHCLMNGKWQEEKKAYIEDLSKAKQKGIVKAVGVSCHNWDAMAEAVEDPWVDVILARINPFGTHMDGTPEAVMGLLAKARKNGKAVIGMKIFGNGGNTSDEERERSLRFALASGNIHTMTLGLESVDELNDAVDRVIRIKKELA